MKASDAEKQSAIEHLKTLLHEGDTVYTVLRHVSRSGMSRGIDLYIIKDNRPMWITSYAGKAIGSPLSRKAWEQKRGLQINGSGMDMGFELVYRLSLALFCPDKYTQDGAYALKHEWL